MEPTRKYIFGPVPSRRLGLSLGIDIIPFKTCTQNCIYCQLGVNAAQVNERQSFIPPRDIIDQLKQRLAGGLRADSLTFSGSGEPTLSSDLGFLIDAFRALSDIRTAVITNGTLLHRPDVRADCSKAHIVLPSLDAPDPETFQLINHPHPDLTFDTFVQGLADFRKEYTGQIWLEVFLVKDLNTSPAHIRRFRDLIATIAPDKIQLNTAVRPVTDPSVQPVPADELEDIACQLGPKAEVIADFAPPKHSTTSDTTAQDILEMLKRRPCTAEDIANSLNIPPDTLKEILKNLEKSRKISRIFTAGKEFFHPHTPSLS
jgi:wyosine [tRNA(Phe)-imidazoG37] synthetase (radical SAM superfamily)